MSKGEKEPSVKKEKRRVEKVVLNDQKRERKKIIDESVGMGLTA